MKKLILAISFAASISTATAATFNLTTGQAAWNCTAAPAAQSCSAVNLGTSPNSIWVSAPSSGFGQSQWIGPTSASGILTSHIWGGTYVYELTLASLPGAGTASFIFGVDNGGRVEWVNNAGTVLSLVAEFPTPFTSINGVGFQSPVTYNGAVAAGAARLRVTVFNDTLPGGSGSTADNGTPTGFFLAGGITAPDVIADSPEPATLSMLGLGGLMLLAVRRKKA